MTVTNVVLRILGHPDGRHTLLRPQLRYEGHSCLKISIFLKNRPSICVELKKMFLQVSYCHTSSLTVFLTKYNFFEELLFFF